ncbi:MAG: glycosyltransferase family 4 protein [Caulobacteraceae bacterium]
MHWTYPVPLYMQGWRNIYTVHDLIPLRDTALTHIKPKRHRRLLTRIAERADRLLTVSESTRTEIVSTLRCTDDFVVNSFQAVHLPSVGDDLPDAVTATGYFLYCESLEPRKNLERLARAWALSGTHRALVVAGPDGWRGSEIRNTLAALNVTVLPFQSRDQLARLIRHARALLFPSLSEGFGLPIAEAMSLGTPVLTSNRGALAEIGGGAVMCVDPLDVHELAQGIRHVCDDDLLCDRMRVAGLERAAAFTQAAFARRMVEIYAEITTLPQIERR